MKKAFTLAELLGAITILGVLAILITPTIDKSIKNGKQTAYDAQIKQIEKASKDWADLNLSILPDSENEIISITVRDLKTSGLLNKDMKNPKTGELFPNDMVISITKNNDKYIFKVDTSSGTQLTNNAVNNAPIVVLNGTYIMYVEINKTFTDPGAVATSSTGTNLVVNTDITKENVAQGSVVTSNLGTYKITYSATDNGFTTKATRTVVVRDTKPPVISAPNISIYQNQVESFNALTGVTVTDNSLQTITLLPSNVTSSLTTIPGNYIVTYKISDSSGNETVKNRIVKVLKNS